MFSLAWLGSEKPPVGDGHGNNSEHETDNPHQDNASTECCLCFSSTSMIRSWSSWSSISMSHPGLLYFVFCLLHLSNVVRLPVTFKTFTLLSYSNVVYSIFQFGKTSACKYSFYIPFQIGFLLFLSERLMMIIWTIYE